MDGAGDEGLSAGGPGLPTCALQQVGRFPGYSGHQINVVVTTARDPKATSKLGLAGDERFAALPKIATTRSDLWIAYD
jgi:hypothetical protein